MEAPFGPLVILVMVVNRGIARGAGVAVAVLKAVDLTLAQAGRGRARITDRGKQRGGADQDAWISSAVPCKSAIAEPSRQLRGSASPVFISTAALNPGRFPPQSQ
jgi:hypothetical protein